MSKVFSLGGGSGGGGIKLVFIAITEPPEKVNYRPGQTFNPAGMVVTATYAYGITQAVTGYTYTPAGALEEGVESVTIKYTEGRRHRRGHTGDHGSQSVHPSPHQSGSLTYNGGAQSPSGRGTTRGNDPGRRDGRDGRRQLRRHIYPERHGGDPVGGRRHGGKDRGLDHPEGGGEPVPAAGEPGGRRGDAHQEHHRDTSGGQGAITASSEPSGVVSTQVSRNTVTVTGLKNRNATVTVHVAADANHNAPADKTCSVQVKFTAVYGVEWDRTASTAWSRTDAAELFPNPTPP